MLVEYYYPWDSSGKNTGVGCHFPTPGDLPNPGIKLASPGSSAFAGDLGWSLGRKEFLAKGMETLSNIYAWEIPWKEEPGIRLRYYWVTKTFTFLSPGMPFNENIDTLWICSCWVLLPSVLEFCSVFYTDY